MKYLLDTNIISELVSKKPNEEVLKFLSSLDDNSVYLSVITIGEIKSGIENLQNITKKENLTKWLENDLLKKFENKIINIDVDIMITWGKINHNLKNIVNDLENIYNQIIENNNQNKEKKILEKKSNY